MSDDENRTTEGQPTLCRTCGEPKAALNQRTLLCSGTQHGPHQTTRRAMAGRDFRLMQQDTATPLESGRVTALAATSP